MIMPPVIDAIRADFEKARMDYSSASMDRIAATAELRSLRRQVEEQRHRLKLVEQEASLGDNVAAGKNEAQRAAILALSLEDISAYRALRAEIAALEYSIAAAQDEIAAAQDVLALNKREMDMAIALAQLLEKEGES